MCANPSPNPRLKSDPIPSNFASGSMMQNQYCNSQFLFSDSIIRVSAYNQTEQRA